MSTIVIELSIEQASPLAKVRLEWLGTEGGTF
jgi:hypothetical protein